MDFGNVITHEDQAAVEDLATLGYHLFGEVADPAAAGALLNDIRAQRRFDHSLFFLTEAEFDADPQLEDVRATPGRNLLERFDGRLDFVEAEPRIVAGLTALLGPGYERLDRRVVCSVPASAVPDWLKARVRRDRISDLGPYVRPDRRDMTYFHGLDFHQDLADHPDRNADVLTLNVYLHPVQHDDAPLLLENSHRLGATAFPHKLAHEWDGMWTYRDGRGQEARTRQISAAGGTGWAGLWHACTLHGAQPDAAGRARISLRYRFAKTTAERTGVDRVNAALQGPLNLAAAAENLASNCAA